MICRVILIYAILSISLFARDFEIKHDRSNLIISESDSGYNINYQGILNLSSINPQVGYPDLPVYVYKVLLPKGQSVESIAINSVKKSILKGKFKISSRQQPWRQNIDDEPGLDTIQTQDLPVLYPRQVIKYLGSGKFSGQAVAHFEVFPVQYNSIKKSLVFIDQISFSIHTGVSELESIQPDLGIRSITQSYKLLSVSDQVVVNASMVVGGNENILSPFAAMENGLIDQYVVITTKELKESFRPLVEWKTQKGVPAIIRTMNWVRANFPNGVDDADRLRNYIRWTYKNRGTRFILLGGETELVPTRMITTGGYTFPTDYYYSDLDGSWNANQNQIFGEAADNTDAYPEVWISRIPVESAADVARFIHKLFKYERLQNITNPDYPANILYMAANLNKDDDGKKLIMDHINPHVNPSFKRTLLTQNEHIGTSHDIPFSELSKNYAMIFTENHGAYHVIHPGKSGPSSIYAYEAAHLNNTDPSIWYMASCSTNDIAKRAFSEVYMRGEHGGVAYIGNSNFEYPFSGIYLQKEFYNLVFNKGYHHLAEAHFLSRLPYLGYMSWEGPSRIIVLSTVVLGDPEMPIWTDKPQEFDIEIDKSDKVSFLIKGSDDHIAVAGAMVVLYNEGAVYKIAESDASGQVNFNRAELNADQVVCTITAHNYVPYQDTLMLPTPAGMDLHISDYQIQFLSGIDNNIIEPGEEFALNLTVQNAGHDTVDGKIKIRTNFNDSPILFNLDSLSNSVNLYPNQEIEFGTLDFTVSSQWQNDTSLVIPFIISLADSFVNTEYLSININCSQVSVAEIKGTSTIIEDSAEIWYSSSIDILMRNDGFGAVNNLCAKMVDNQNYMLLDTSVYQIGQISAQNEQWIFNAFTIIHQIPLPELDVLIRLYGPSIPEIDKIMNFKNPEPVTSISFLPSSSTSLQLSWKSSLSKDISGYHIYRRNPGEQRFQQINKSPVRQSGFYLDDSLQTDQSYEYVIQSEDSSGNLSGFSADTLTAWPALSYWPGFPLRVSEQAMGSNLGGVQITDMDNDNRNEIITAGGLGVLKVYNDQAQELYSTTELKGFMTLPAMGNVFGSASKEIVVSSYTEGMLDNYLYIIDGQSGDILHTFDLGYNSPTTTVLKDLDGNGLDDIILLTHAGNAPEPPKNSRLFIWKSTGTGWDYFPGWSEQGYMLQDNYCLGNPAAADLDRSGVITVLASTMSGKLHGFKPTLGANPQWSVSLSGHLTAAMSIADIDGNDTLDILIPALKDDKLYLVNHRGHSLPGWADGLSLDITNPWYRGSPAVVGNLDQDTDLEIAYVGRQNIYIIEKDASIKVDWPIPIKNGDDFFSNTYKHLSCYASPVLVDLNSDNISEIIFVTTFGWLHAIDPITREDIKGFPINFNLDMIHGQSPIVHDINKDGILDILFMGHDGNLHIWDIGKPYPDGSKLYWNQVHANEAHTGELDTTILGSSTSIAEENSMTIPEKYYVRQNYPNPFNPVTTIEFGLARTSNVRIDIYNILGQKVITLMNESYTPGNYSIKWNGKNKNGIMLSSGIYFYRVEIRDSDKMQFLPTHSGKMILLK